MSRPRSGSRGSANLFPVHLRYRTVGCRTGVHFVKKLWKADFFSFAILGSLRTVIAASYFVDSYQLNLLVWWPFPVKPTWVPKLQSSNRLFSAKLLYYELSNWSTTLLNSQLSHSHFKRICTRQETGWRWAENTRSNGRWVCTCGYTIRYTCEMQSMVLCWRGSQPQTIVRYHIDR